MKRKRPAYFVENFALLIGGGLDATLLEIANSLKARARKYPKRTAEILEIIHSLRKRRLDAKAQDAVCDGIALGSAVREVLVRPLRRPFKPREDALAFYRQEMKAGRRPSAKDVATHLEGIEYKPKYNPPANFAQVLSGWLGQEGLARRKS